MSDTGGGRACSAQEVFQRYLCPPGAERCVVGVLDGELSGLVGWLAGLGGSLDGFFFPRSTREAPSRMARVNTTRRLGHW